MSTHTHIHTYTDEPGRVGLGSGTGLLGKTECSSAKEDKRLFTAKRFDVPISTLI